MGELGGAFKDVLERDKTHNVTLSRHTNCFKLEKNISIAKMMIDKCKAAILIRANTEQIGL